MKFMDGIKLTGFPAIIPRTSRNHLPAFLVEMGYKVGAEIGVYKGEYTQKFCLAGLKMYGIDPWMHYPNYRRHSRETPQDVTYGIAQQSVKGFDATLIRKTSMDALADFPDESLDFVYIDANHAFPYVAQDIYEWQRKVRKGGIISGHDYFNCNHHPYWLRVCHVKYAVDVCVKLFGVETFYIFGDRDRCPSWMWIKA